MSKIRGKYKQYIGNRNVPVPQTTLYRWKKELNRTCTVSIVYLWNTYKYIIETTVSCYLL